MTKRRAENILPPEIPHKRCLRSLSNIDKSVRVGENTMQSCNPAPLSSNRGERCRKRPNCNEDSTNTDDSPIKLPTNSVNYVLRNENTCKSGTFVDVGKNVARRTSHAVQVVSKKEPEDESVVNIGDKVMHTDEDLSAYNTFQFWRTPLPELDLSLLEPSSGPNDGSSTKDLEAMET